MTGEEEQIFLTAREGANRTAFARWAKTQNLPPGDSAAVQDAVERWRALPLLTDPKLLDTCLWALGESLGRSLSGSEPFPLTIWLGGAEDTHDGRHFSGNIEQFVKLLQVRARELAPKRTGWVVEPTTNPTGRRTNECTLQMHSLFLDCDGSGDWDQLLGALDILGFCYVAYQSGGWTAETPKWRIALPLNEPFDTSTPAKQAAWKAAYNHCRVVFGAVARLRGVGFDPATETPCCPWFLTEKREVGAPERVVRWRPGRALDLVAMMLALPDVPAEDRAPREERVITPLSLDEDRLNVIIDALTAATNAVPTGRRDLYLALPGALLDRGVQPDDVIAIVEGVSASYPRKHPEKHADNMHCAKTTLSRFENGEVYTRIGALNACAPHVAQALDSVLPDPTTSAIADAMERLLEEPTPTVQVPSVPTVEASSSSSSPPTSTKKRRRMKNLSNLGREIASIVTRYQGSPNPTKKLHAIVIGCFLDGIAVPCSPLTTDAQIDDVVCKAMQALGRTLRVQTRWHEVMNLASSCLSLTGITQSTERLAAVERAFYEGQGKRKQRIAKQEAEIAKSSAERDAFFAELEKRQGR